MVKMMAFNGLFLIYWAFIGNLISLINVVDSKLVIQEHEWGKITRKQIQAEADLVAKIEEQDASCKYRKVLL